MTKEIFKIKSASAECTETAGAKLAEIVASDSEFPRFIAICGGLGAGKTAFTRGICSRFCPNAAVRSPSFALVNEYRGDTEVYHFDVWRINDDDDLYSTGFYDYQDRPGVIVCEWADNIEYALPDKYIRVDINGNGDDEREITVNLIEGDVL